MPSKPTTGGGRQLRLAQPKIDRYGLHALDCECVRCELGQRPTIAQRNHARWAFERREKRAKAAAVPVDPPAAVEKSLARSERLGERERRTGEVLKEIARPVERPATADELRDLRAIFGLEKRKERKR